MKKAILVLLITFGANFPVFGTVIEVNIEVNPVISHIFEERVYPGTGMLVDYIADSLEIALPDVTFASGDIFRVNVSFINGKFLKVGNAAPHVEIMPSLSTSETGASGSTTSDSSIQVQITSYQNVINTTKTKSSNFWATFGKEEYEIRDSFFWWRDSGEITDGSLMGGFRTEFVLPTIYEGAPVPLADYNYNILLVTSQIYGQNLEDMNLLEVIPEPASVLLLGVGMMLLRRRSC